MAIIATTGTINSNKSIEIFCEHLLTKIMFNILITCTGTRQKFYCYC